MTHLALVDALQHVHRLLHHLVLVGGERVLAVVNGDGVQATRNRHRGRAGVERVELLRVERGGGDDEAEVGTLLNQLLAQTEQDVRVNAAVVGFVQHDNTVLAEERVCDELLHETAVRDVLDLRPGGGFVVEPNPRHQ